MVWDPQKPKISLLDPPMDPIFGPFCGQKGQIWGQKACVSQKCIFTQNDISGSSDHFSLGSKWVWYLQNDKMYTLGPTDSPSPAQPSPSARRDLS